MPVVQQQAQDQWVGPALSDDGALPRRKRNMPFLVLILISFASKTLLNHTVCPPLQYTCIIHISNKVSQDQAFLFSSKKWETICTQLLCELLTTVDIKDADDLS